VVPPPPGVLHELHLFQELAARVGLTAAMSGTIDDYKRRLLRPVAHLGVTLERLRQGPVNPRNHGLLFPERRVLTPSGKVMLLDTVPELPDPDPDYPLWLFSNSTEKSQASQWSGRGLGERTWVVVHPAVVPGRSAGEPVIVESPLGSLRAELRLEASQRRDVAIMPKGGHYDRGHAANALIPARLTDLGLGAAYLDCCVRIR
jgi:anaerobic selenocysteine-containing dehydrogenase